MAEATLASDMLIALVDGVQSNKFMEAIYKKFEDDPGNIEECVDKFDESMAYLGEIYDPEVIAGTNWCRPHLFYSLFTSIAHGLYDLNNLDDVERPEINKRKIGKIRAKLDEISFQYDQYTSEKQLGAVPAEFRDFIDKSRRRTTDSGSRIDRAEFICNALINT